MIAPAPFVYPAVAHQRRHGPSGYKNYQDYKPWLRDEFTFRCVYCLEREMWHPNRAAAFSVDHILPQSEGASRICDYENLLYACTRCNTARQDVRTLDPTATALADHLQVQGDGSIQALTVEGRDLIDLLHLDVNPPLRVRQKVLRLLALKVKYPGDPEIHQEFLEAFGFPDDLPDLSKLKPPGGNAREAGKESCYYRLREAKNLPETY